MALYDPARRHFESGPSKHGRERYRIDSTANDGDGLVADDGMGHPAIDHSVKPTTNQPDETKRLAHGSVASSEGF